MDMHHKSYFISDLHLGAGYISDHRAYEKAIVEWLEEIGPTARNLFMLGDILDYWYEYKNVAPRGFIRFFGALARLADSGTEIVWLKGNHDIWLFDYLKNEIGLTVVDGVYERILDGTKFVMEHGDGVGRLPFGYRLMRNGFRSRFLQWLYAGIHPRWTIAFAHGWSSKSRLETPVPKPEMIRRDIDRLTGWAVEYNQTHANSPAQYFVFGHLHTPMLIGNIDNSATLAVLGAGICDFQYGEWDGTSFKLIEKKLGQDCV